MRIIKDLFVMLLAFIKIVSTETNIVRPVLVSTLSTIEIFLVSTLSSIEIEAQFTNSSRGWLMSTLRI